LSLNAIERQRPDLRRLPIFERSSQTRPLGAPVKRQRCRLRAAED
jgi:hypothetical protein